jgi:hypothetical protein
MSETCDAESAQASWTASHEAGATEWYESSLASASAYRRGDGGRATAGIPVRAVNKHGGCIADDLVYNLSRNHDRMLSGRHMGLAPRLSLSLVAEADAETIQARLETQQSDMTWRYIVNRLWRHSSRLLVVSTL